MVLKYKEDVFKILRFSEVIRGVVFKSGVEGRLDYVEIYFCYIKKGVLIKLNGEY